MGTHQRPQPAEDTRNPRIILHGKYETHERILRVTGRGVRWSRKRMNGGAMAKVLANNGTEDPFNQSFQVFKYVHACRLAVSTSKRGLRRQQGFSLLLRKMYRRRLAVRYHCDQVRCMVMTCSTAAVGLQRARTLPRAEHLSALDVSVCLPRPLALLLGNINAGVSTHGTTRYRNWLPFPAWAWFCQRCLPKRCKAQRSQ